jgi:uncharacterized caspase-like protein
VVGNAAYVNVAPLTNSANDARLMAETLRGLGFTLVGGIAQTDLDKAGFDTRVQQFGALLQGADVGLFYYAGHGVQVRGTNYLVPVGPTRRERPISIFRCSTPIWCCGRWKAPAPNSTL